MKEKKKALKTRSSARKLRKSPQSTNPVKPHSGIAKNSGRVFIDGQAFVDALNRAVMEEERGRERRG